MSTPMLFRSVKHPGVVMNRYGRVMRGATLCHELRAEIYHEAIEAGWRHMAGPDYADVGLTWHSPEEQQQEQQ